MPDRLLRVLLWWTALTTVVFWLPVVRGAFDGTSYQWGLFGLSGRGLHGDYWLPLLGTAFALTTQALGWRGARMPFHVLLMGWHTLLGVGAAYLALANPADFRFQGDTLGIDVSLAVWGPMFFGAWAALAVFWSLRDLRRARRAPVPTWTSRNTRWVALLVALLPMQFVLLGFGAPNSAMDQIGVVVTIIQWLLVGVALRPRMVPAGVA